MGGGALAERGGPRIGVEEGEGVLGGLRDEGVEVVAGPVAPAEMVRAANAAEARSLIVAIPNCFEAGQIVSRARAANPAIEIVARAHSDAAVEHLRSLGADAIVMGERENARAMVDWAFRPAPAGRPATGAVA